MISKNIRALFYLTATLAILACIAGSYRTWVSVNEKYQLKNESSAKIIARALSTYLKQVELISVSLARQKDMTRGILAELTQIDDSIVSLALINPDGSVRITDHGKQASELPNLMRHEKTRESFLQVLNSSEPLLGRSYYFSFADTYGFPLRKTIRNAEGEPETVLSIAISIENHTLFDEAMVSQSDIINVIRAADFYPQIVIRNGQHLTEKYDQPFSLATREKFIQTIKHRYRLTLEQIKATSLPVSFVGSSALDQQKYIISFLFMPEHQLWVGSYLLHDKMLAEFYHAIATYIVALTVILMLVWLSFRHIARLEYAKSQDLMHQANHDSLTQLPNRNFLLAQQKVWFGKDNGPFCLMYVDMDQFKNINDSFGHEFGDMVLKELAQRLQNTAPEDGIVMRQGGDEFLLQIPSINHDRLEQIARSLIRTLSQPYQIDATNVEMGVSIGIALYPEHAQNLDSLLRAADIAMYEAKTQRNSLRFFDTRMFHPHQQRLMVEQQMRSGLNHNEFFMMYQPQIAYTGELYGVEALVRWQNDTLGFVPPDQFIGIAESSGLMPRLGQHIIVTALNEIAEIHQQFDLSFHLAINISVKQLMHEHFLPELEQAIGNSAISKVNVTIEITESLFIEDLNQVLPILAKIHDLGMQISMDDFGTGYSSLSMLSALPIDELKVDKSFVDNILNDIAARKMIQNIIAIGKNYGMSVLAEGVETKEQAMLLTQFGCDRFQGYYFSKPLTQQDLAGFLSAAQVSESSSNSEK